MKTKKRLGNTAEFFTPAWLVDQILDKAGEYALNMFNDPDKTTLDPTCGDGNIVMQVLKRKHQFGMSKEDAIMSTYGVDIMVDNICDLIVRIAFWYHFDHDFNISKLPYEDEQSVYWLFESNINDYERSYCWNSNIITVSQKPKEPWLFKYKINSSIVKALDFSKNFVVADALTYDYEFDGKMPFSNYQLVA